MSKKYISELDGNDIMLLTMDDSKILRYVEFHLINKKEHRIEVLNKAIKHGFNIDYTSPTKKIKPFQEPLLFTACSCNDLLFIGNMIKHNANIHIKTIFDDNVLHHCVEIKNPTLLKYFISKGVDINNVNSVGVTPLEYACEHTDGECAKVLLSSPNIKITHDREQFPILHTVVDNLMKENGKYRANHFGIFESIVNKKTKFEKVDMDFLFMLMHENYLDEIKVFIKKFPHIVNKKMGGESIAFTSLIDDRYDILDTIIKSPQFDYTKKNQNNETFLHVLASKGYVDIMRTYISLYPNSVNLLCSYGMTAFDHTLTSSIIIDNDIKHKIADILFEANINVSCVDIFGISTIENAIQYSDYFMVEKILKINANTYSGHTEKKEINENFLYPVAGKNDLIGFATQLGKYDIVELLVKYNVPFKKIYCKGYTIHTSILLAIMFDRPIILDFLLCVPEVKSNITSQQKLFLIDYAINCGTASKHMLTVISGDEKMTEFFNVTETIRTTTNFIEKCIIRCFDKYSNYNSVEKIEFLNVLSTILMILSDSIHTTTNTILNPFSKMSILYDFIISSECDVDSVNILVDIISCMLDCYNIRALRQCIIYVHDIETCHFCDFHTNQLVNKIKSTVHWFSHTEDKINQSCYILTKLITHYENEKNDIQKITRIVNHQYDTTLKSLFKLRWPVKVPHYDYMVENLIANKDEIIKNEETLTVNCENGIRSTLLKIQNGVIPERWINTYAPNIGADAKDDYNHSFSFKLDKVLSEWPCIIETIPDPTHHSGSNKKMFFYGILQYNNHISTGCYEYFINSHGTLFHRMFRPYSSLPKEIIKRLDISILQKQSNT